MTKTGRPLVLVADDDPDILRMLQHCLQQWGYEAVCANDKSKLMEEVFRRPPTLIVLDLYFGEHDGLEILVELQRRRPCPAVVLLTAHGSIDSAVQAMKFGACDYLTKPVDLNRLQTVVARLVEEQQALPAAEKAGTVAADATPRPLVGVSPAMNRLRELIAGVAPTDATVLILGESGTGKELVARALHTHSRRAAGPFVPLNMAALPRELVESTLFGHEQGAFTGAHQARKGCCETADGGTLFLDEIGEMEIGLQAKLLRFLQDQNVQRVGSGRTRKVDVRIVSATNRDPIRLVEDGRLREDLYYRLNVVPLVIPPLRERREDVPLLCARFLERAAARLGKSLQGFAPDAMQRLTDYAWPGNIRQLENLVERLAIFATGPFITADLLPAEIGAGIAGGAAVNGATAAAAETRPAEGGEGFAGMEQIERQAIVDALDRAGGHVGEAARLLGLGQATVYRKIKRYGIPTDRRRRSDADDS